MGDIIDRKRAAGKVCHVILKYSDDTANMIDHTRRKHGDLTAPTATPSASIVSLSVLHAYGACTSKARLGKGQGAKEIGHNPAARTTKIWAQFSAQTTKSRAQFRA